MCLKCILEVQARYPEQQLHFLIIGRLYITIFELKIGILSIFKLIFLYKKLWLTTFPFHVVSIHFRKFWSDSINFKLFPEMSSNFNNCRRSAKSGKDRQRSAKIGKDQRRSAKMVENGWKLVENNWKTLKTVGNGWKPPIPKSPNSHSGVMHHPIPKLWETMSAAQENTINTQDKVVIGPQGSGGYMNTGI